MSILSDPAIVELLKTRFVPVAVDQHDHRRRQDAEGEFFASVLKQAGRGLDGYSQGFYIFSPAGKLLEFENTLSGSRMKGMLASALKKFDPAAPVPALDEGKADARFVYQLPEGGLVIQVTSKVLGGYSETSDSNINARQTALGRDHLWLRKDEAEQLVRGILPDSVKMRIARFHLVDNTRGEPPFWREDEIQHLKVALDQGQLTGTVRLETKSSERGFDAQLRGIVEVSDGKVTRFDAVVKGDFWGEGTYSRGAPKGKFPFAVAFTLASGERNESKIPPGGARGNLKGYLR